VPDSSPAAGGAPSCIGGALGSHPHGDVRGGVAPLRPEGACARAATPDPSPAWLADEADLDLL